MQKLNLPIYPIKLKKEENKTLVFDPIRKKHIVLTPEEWEAPSIKISQDTFDQIARYNMTLKTDLLVVTNGLQHYICIMDHHNKRYHFLQEIPNYSNEKT